MIVKPMLSSLKILNKSSKLISNRKFSSFVKEENWCCNSFFPAKPNSQILKSDAIVITNTILPKHFTRFWDSSKQIKTFAKFLQREITFVLMAAPTGFTISSPLILMQKRYETGIVLIFISLMTSDSSHNPS